MSETQEDTVSGSWLQWAADVANSTKHNGRKRQYEEIRGEIREGQSLMMRCEIAGTDHPSYIIIEDFVAFNWLMERLDDPWDYLVSIKPMIVAMELTNMS